jgi:hypothetical protein
MLNPYESPKFKDLTEKFWEADDEFAKVLPRPGTGEIRVTKEWTERYIAARDRVEKTRRALEQWLERHGLDC